MRKLTVLLVGTMLLAAAGCDDDDIEEPIIPTADAAAPAPTGA